MDRIQVKSELITSVGYSNGDLTVEFHNGSIYVYRFVPEQVYVGLMAAPSKGSYFHKSIKRLYDGEKIS